VLGGDSESDDVMGESGKNALSSLHQLLRNWLVWGGTTHTHSLAALQRNLD
jgi:hypothetical protein